MKIVIYAKDIPESVRPLHIVERIEIESEIYGDKEIKPIGSEMDELGLEINHDTLSNTISFDLDCHISAVAIKHLFNKHRDEG